MRGIGHQHRGARWLDALIRRDDAGEALHGQGQDAHRIAPTTVISSKVNPTDIIYLLPLPRYLLSKPDPRQQAVGEVRLKRPCLAVARMVKGMTRAPGTTDWASTTRRP